MGYDTWFEGDFTVTPQLSAEHAAYLTAFADTRRVRRDPSKAATILDPLRVAEKHAARDEINHELCLSHAGTLLGCHNGQSRALSGSTSQSGAVRVTRRNPHVTGVFPGSSTARYTLITVSGTRMSLSGWLARMGFADVPRAERELAVPGTGEPTGSGAIRPVGHAERAAG